MPVKMVFRKKNVDNQRDLPVFLEGEPVSGQARRGGDGERNKRQSPILGMAAPLRRALGQGCRELMVEAQECLGTPESSRTDRGGLARRVVER